MEEQRAVSWFRSNTEHHSRPLGRVTWQTVRRPRRGNTPVPVQDSGPYEVSYSIVNGYPDREVVLP